MTFDWTAMIFIKGWGHSRTSLFSLSSSLKACLSYAVVLIVGRTVKLWWYWMHWCYLLLSPMFYISFKTELIFKQTHYYPEKMEYNNFHLTVYFSEEFVSAFEIKRWSRPIMLFHEKPRQAVPVFSCDDKFPAIQSDFEILDGTAVFKIFYGTINFLKIN